MVAEKFFGYHDHFNEISKAKILECDGVFEYVGMEPISQFTSNLNITDESGWIITNSTMKTSQEGIFAIGDVRQDTIRQVVTATGDGCVAAQMAQHYIESLKQ